MSSHPPISRRDLFAGAVALSAGAALARPAPAEAALTRGPDTVSVPADGVYEGVDLIKPRIRLSAVQSRVRGVEVDNLNATRKANLDHMLSLIDAANNWGGSKDLLFFHEFPITGYSNRWSREDALKVAIELDGPEVEAVGAKAKEYGCYVVFGSYVKDPAWPKHVLSITSMVGPDGTLVDAHWKARNIKAVFGPGFELFTTTIYDVLEQYVEMYGLDAVVPVTRTPIGNIATSSVQREPELFRAFAMKGAEIILRTATGGFTPMDMAATSLYNGVYTALVNNAYSPDNPGFFADAGGGGTTIWGPDGKEITSATSEHEQGVTATIPIADFRARHRPPYVHMALYAPVFDAYVNRYPPNLFAEYQPTDTSDAYQYLKDKGVWNK